MSATHRYTLPRSDDHDPELVAAALWAAGAAGVWERPDAWVAWFPTRRDDVPGAGTWELEPDRDWQEEWKAGLAPVHAGRVAVVPTWLAADHVPGEDEVTIVLDPGRAFGSGHHATTLQCLELLQRLELTGRRVLDVGCGTGVLALAAAGLGAATVEAVDVDPDAVEVTRGNAARNGVTLAARVGSVGAASGPADVVLANLVTDTIVSLAPALVGAVRPGGALVASGIAAERRERAVAALGSAGLSTEVEVSRDGWVALLGRRPPGTAGFATDPARRSP